MDESAAYERLATELASLGSVLVAFSGGVDSTLLAAVAHEVLGDAAQAVHAASPIHPTSDERMARELADHIGIELTVVASDELDDAVFTANAPDRCYHCKKHLMGLFTDLARERGLAHVVDGANVDDLGDHRPGTAATREIGVISPLQRAGMTKQMIRSAARRMGLPNWDLPSMACLASRFPYGEPITIEGLRRVERAEQALAQQGFSAARVRSHGDLARVEVSPDALEEAWASRLAWAGAVKDAGFTWVALDTTGYRTGAMNEVLDLSHTHDESTH